MSNIIKVRDNNGNWLGIPALKGVDGITPHIGENGNWFIGTDDTGVAASGITELPIASADTLGAIKVGNNLTIDENGVLSGNDVDLTSYAKKSELPTKVSDLTNDSLFITNTVNNLTNYYTKTETYTQEQINDLISAAAGLKLEVVSVLPTIDISTSTIYLKGTETEGTNDYEEWIYVNNNWELIGTTEVDLTNYLTEEDLYDVMTRKDSYIMPKKYIDVLSGWRISSTRLSDSDITTESLYSFLYNFFSKIDPVFKGTKTAAEAMAELQEYKYAASSEPYTSNFGTVFNSLKQIYDVFGGFTCYFNDYAFRFIPYSIRDSFIVDVYWGTTKITWQVRLGSTMVLSCTDEANLATKKYVDDSISNIDIPIYALNSSATTISVLCTDLVSVVNNIYQDYINNKSSILNLTTTLTAPSNSVSYSGIYSVSSVTDTQIILKGAEYNLSKIRSASGVSANTIISVTITGTITDSVITGCSIYDGYRTNDAYFLETSYNYSTPYEPQYDGSPATKKYVDNSVNNKGIFWVTLTEDSSTTSGYAIDKNITEISNAFLNENRPVYIKYTSSTSEYMWELPLIQFIPSTTTNSYIFFQEVDGWYGRVELVLDIATNAVTLSVSWGVNQHIDLGAVYGEVIFDKDTWSDFFKFMKSKTNYVLSTIHFPYEVYFKESDGTLTHIGSLSGKTALCKLSDGNNQTLDFSINELEYNDTAQRRRIVISYNVRTGVLTYKEYEIPMITQANIDAILPYRTVVIPNNTIIKEDSLIQDVLGLTEPPSGSGTYVYYFPKGLNFFGGRGWRSAFLFVSELDVGAYDVSGFGFDTNPGCIDYGQGSGGMDIGTGSSALLQSFSVSYEYYADDPILPYWYNFKHYDYVNAGDVLTRSNKSEYTPTTDYHPATKKYVDDSIRNINIPNALSDTDINSITNNVFGGGINV